jgi:hypothetical protein
VRTLLPQAGTSFVPSQDELAGRCPGWTAGDHQDLLLLLHVLIQQDVHIGGSTYSATIMGP